MSTTFDSRIDAVTDAIARYGWTSFDSYEKSGKWAYQQSTDAICRTALTWAIDKQDYVAHVGSRSGVGLVVLSKELPKGVNVPCVFHVQPLFPGACETQVATPPVIQTSWLSERVMHAPIKRPDQGNLARIRGMPYACEICRTLFWQLMLSGYYSGGLFKELCQVIGIASRTRMEQLSRLRKETGMPSDKVIRSHVPEIAVDPSKWGW